MYVLGVFNNSLPPSCACLSAYVKFSNCKSFLDQFYAVPYTYRITKYHVFRFWEEDPHFVQVKRSYKETQWENICLLKSSVSPERLRT